MIPKGKQFHFVVRIRAKEREEALTEMSDKDMANCPTCSNLENACSCDHH